MSPIGADHTKKKTPPVIEGMDVAPLIDGTASDDEATARLRAFYGGKQFEYGWASLCRMYVPAGLEGKTVLDIGCRRGRGVYKLSDRVGAAGCAIGLDWGRDYVEEAVEWSAHAASKSGLAENNMSFALGFPENLAACGIEDESVDAVWVNSVLNLTFDRAQCLREMHRVLKPGGMVICETVVADGERDEDVVDRARAIGNSVQAAPSRRAFLAELCESGFGEVSSVEGHDVEADAGFKPGYAVETVESDEVVAFAAEVFIISKR